MKRTTTRYDAQGNVIGSTVVESRGCLTWLAVGFAWIVVLFGPIAWMPLPLAAACYAFLALFIIAKVAKAKQGGARRRQAQ